MSNGPSEEERRRKIIIDTEVQRIAGRGIIGTVTGQFNGEKVRALIKCDQAYIRMVKEIDAGLVEDIQLEGLEGGEGSEGKDSGNGLDEVKLGDSSPGE